MFQTQNSHNPTLEVKGCFLGVVRFGMKSTPSSDYNENNLFSARICCH